MSLKPCLIPFQLCDWKNYWTLINISFITYQKDGEANTCFCESCYHGTQYPASTQWMLVPLPFPLAREEVVMDFNCGRNNWDHRSGLPKSSNRTSLGQSKIKIPRVECSNLTLLTMRFTYTKSYMEAGKGYFLPPWLHYAMRRGQWKKMFSSTPTSWN